MDTQNDIFLAQGPVRINTDAVQLRYSRASGPGGQHVNKTSTRAELVVAIDDMLGMPEDAVARLRKLAGKRIDSAGLLHLTSEEFRSQVDNRNAVAERLQTLIKEALIRPKKRKPTKPSRASKERRINAKKARGQIKSMRRGPSGD